MIVAPGEHQPVGIAFPEFTAHAEMMGAVTVVLKAHRRARGRMGRPSAVRRAPCAVPGTSGEEERCADAAAVMGPAGAVVAVVEIVVAAEGVLAFLDVIMGVGFDVGLVC